MNSGFIENDLEQDATLFSVASVPGLKTLFRQPSSFDQELLLAIQKLGMEKSFKAFFLRKDSGKICCYLKTS